MKKQSLLFMLLRLVFWTHKVTIFILPQSVKVREAYVKGNVKGSHIIVGLPHSVKVREGYVKSNVKPFQSDDFTAVREGP